MFWTRAQNSAWLISSAVNVNAAPSVIVAVPIATNAMAGERAPRPRSQLSNGATRLKPALANNMRG